MNYERALAALKPGFVFGLACGSDDDAEPVTVRAIEGDRVLLETRADVRGWWMRADIAAALAGATESASGRRSLRKRP